MPEDKNREKLIERLLVGTAIATIAGYIGLAWAILHRERHPTTPPIAPTPRKDRLP